MKFQIILSKDVPCLRSQLPTPPLSPAEEGMKMTEAKWRDFLNQWARYKRCSGVGGQDVVDDLVLCLSDDSRLEVTSELGESLDNIMRRT